MKTRKNHCFFNAKPLPMPAARGVQRLKVCNCRQSHFSEKIKTKKEKVEFAPLSSEKRPKVGLLENMVPDHM